MKQKILFLSGLPGSGKSTLALKLCEENPNFKRLNKDTIREELGNPGWSRKFEDQVLDTQRYRGLQYLEEGFSIIIDDTNFAEKHLIFWKSIAEKQGCLFEEKFIDTPLEVCIDRDKNRPNPVGEEVIRKMYNQYLKPSNTKTDTRLITQQDKSLPKCIIVDIDGTLALINGRSPYDDSKIYTDKPNQPVIDLIKRFKLIYDFERMESDGEINSKIILMSGRMDKCLSQTTDWLKQNNVPWDFLLMRKTNDYRQDSIVKKELYERHIRDEYYVEAIFDDRDSVVKMWREELGLLCLQVYYGNF